MRRMRSLPLLLLLTQPLSTVASNLQGQGRVADLEGARKYFTDTLLTDQDGKKVKFYSDLVMGKVVVINSFFTSCGATCPIISGTMQKLQTWLGDRLGDEVHLISISVDPTTDTWR